MNLQSLPEELLQHILSHLTKPHLSCLNLVSKWWYGVATPLIWRELELVDCRTHHSRWLTDEHDDTPIIKKLLVLVAKPWIAREVQTLTHRCHLPPPAIFDELPLLPFCSATLEGDVRTIELMKTAVREMRKVSTVRIVLGHPGLTDVILRGLFDRTRERDVKIRKLWLENCRVSVGLMKTIQEGSSNPYGLPTNLDFGGLESVRFRRLPMRPEELVRTANVEQIVYSRGGSLKDFQDGLGGRYRTTVSDVDMELKAGEDYVIWLEAQKGRPDFDQGKGWATENEPFDLHPLMDLFHTAHTFDDGIYEALGETTELPQEIAQLETMSRQKRAEIAYRGSIVDCGASIQGKEPVDLDTRRERMSSADVAISMLRNAGSTLTSLNLDWVLNTPRSRGWQCAKTTANWYSFYLSLFSCRFPHLRAFQVRNAVVPDTIMPEGLYLLDHSFNSTTDAATDLVHLRHVNDGYKYPMSLAGLEFMEAHPGIQCLAFPVDHFFSHRGVPADVVSRIRAVIDNLGRTLLDLRVDTTFKQYGEEKSEEYGCDDHAARSRRRLFITEFAAKMQRVESIKIEGGMPRDERREIIRALHACPLQKIVMIGICSPLGNTWGANGEEVGDLVPDIDSMDLEGEDKTAIYDFASRTPEAPQPGFEYQPQYGWQGQPPMLHSLVSFHSDTIKELKFCGYKGSAILFSPTAITTPILSSLRHFHNIESLIMSMWLVTNFEGSDHDDEVIAYWTNARSPASTALVRITDEEPEGWEKELKTKYAPDALAWRITSFLGPFLSERAKARKGGVHVRASFCIGVLGGIFDVDLWIGKGAVGSDVCLKFVGPREEFEDERRKGKLEERRWF